MKCFYSGVLCGFVLAATPTAFTAESPAGVQNTGTREFRFQFLALAGGTFIESAAGINNAGQICGSFGVDWSQYQGRTVLWNAVSIMNIQAPPNSTFIGSAINQRGEIAGYLHFPPGMYRTDTHAASWSDSGIIDLDDYHSTRATALNIEGKVVGWLAAAGRDPTAMLWDHGKAVDLGALLKRKGYSEAHAINSSSRVVGNFDELADTKVGRKLLGTRAIVWEGSTVRFLATKVRHSSDADGINDRGQIVGWSSVRPAKDGEYDWRAHATLWDGDSVIDLGGLPGFGRMSAAAINSAGEIVGSADNVEDGPLDPSEHHGVFWNSQRQIVDLNRYLPGSLSKEGWVITRATGINDAGAIVGVAYKSSTESRAFLLSPKRP
jgi:probable HAF family extracellular repeat protein